MRGSFNLINDKYLEEIKKGLNFIKESDELCEIRMLKTDKGTISGYYNDYERLADDIKPYIGKYNVFFTLNPVKKDLISKSKNKLKYYAKNTTSDADITKRRILLIDLDAVRPTGTSSTDEEHKSAIERAKEVEEFLEEQGWSEPILADSGNGAHLLYHIDLENNSNSVQLIKNVLKVLDEIFSDEKVDIDKSVYNAARICKLYGSVACKGDNTEDRPHRMAKVLEYPEKFEKVDVKQLQKLTSMLPNEKEKNNRIDNHNKIDIKSWMKRYGIEVFKEKNWGNATVYVLEKCPWREEHTDYSAYIIQFDNGAIVAGCHHDHCSQENWYTLRDKLEPGWRKNNKKDRRDAESTKKSQSDILIELASQAEFFSDYSEETYCSIKVDNHVEVYKLSSLKFKMWLTKIFFDKTGKAITSESMKQVIGVLNMKALTEEQNRYVSKRCVKYDEKIYYDLCDNNWKVVVIDENDWKIIDNNEPMFLKNKNLKAQVIPEKYEDLSILSKFYRFRNEDDKILHMVDIVTKFIPNIPHPIIVIYGEKGSSKTTSMRKDRSIVDPAIRDIVAMPTSNSDLGIILNNNYMPCFDNIDNISAGKSDILCMAATGGGFSKRKLFTDEDETILFLKDCVVLNGINVVATRPDLLDRSILLELERIPDTERKDEETIWKEFNDAKPKILGAIFTMLSRAMKLYKTIKVEKLGRMADFTKWGYAIAEVSGIGGEKFIGAYLNNQNRANDEAVESNPVASVVIAFMKDRKNWSGTISEFLEKLYDVAFKEKIDTNSKLWPNEPNVLSRRLNEVKSNLLLYGISYTIRHHSKSKKITIIKETDVSVKESDIIDF
jgi:DNA-directed RNA polymerase subunit F